jgi:hypothetical protein
MKLITLSLVALALSATTVLGTFYGPAGQYQGSANTFGNTTTYGTSADQRRICL